MIKSVPDTIPIHELLRNRWSARAFDEKMISDNELSLLFQAASWSSSSMNEQPWRFVYGKRGEVLHGEILSVLMPGNAVWAIKAPILMAVFAKKNFSDGSTNLHAWHDVGAACTTLLLQGVAMGIYGHQMGGFDRSKAKEAFSYPEEYEMVSIIALGFLGNPDILDEPFKTRELTPRERKSPERFAFTSFDQL